MPYTENNRLSLKYNGTLNIALYESERSYVFTYVILLKRNFIIIINLNWAISPIKKLISQYIVITYRYILCDNDLNL